MQMLTYIIKRILLMLLTVFIIFTICFVLIKSLPQPPPVGNASQVELELAIREKLGYNKPIMEQYGIYLNNIITKGDWGTSWKIEKFANVTDVLFSRITPTLVLNIYSLIFAMKAGM